jgi:LysR family hydrogen peroxide-inducible transcriptional activator
MAVKKGLLNGTEVEARPLEAPHASRDIALVWRTNSPRQPEFELLAETMRELVPV